MLTLNTPGLPNRPTAQGPVSGAVIERLADRAPSNHLEPVRVPLRDSDPLGIDVQLALHVCYELHYLGFTGVDPAWEWNAGLLHLRSQLERLFLAAVHHAVGELPADVTVTTEMDRLATPSADGMAEYLRERGTWDQMREYFIHRSLDHLKEGDPHAWLIPRLAGQARASFAAVEFDESGAGRGSHVHRQLFADLMAAADLDGNYLGYLDAVPAQTLAVVNLMSLFALHRRYRGAAAGHFAATEFTESARTPHMVAALERAGAPAECMRFYRKHAETDSLHDEVIRRDVIGDLLSREPELAPDVVFGMRAQKVVEGRLTDHLSKSWTAGHSSLSRPLDELGRLSWPVSHQSLPRHV